MAIPASSTSAGESTERDQLSKRAIPHMVLANENGSPSTACQNASRDLAPVESARDRFSVRGNAIVTGGTGALGLAACHALLEHGLANLVIFDANASHSEKQLRTLTERFPSSKISLVQIDVTDEAAVRAAVDQAVKELHSIDHLLCFSGIVGCVDSLEAPVAQFRRVIDVNTTGSFICAQAVARKMVQQGTGGSIVFTASISAHRVNYPQPQAAYNVSKAALITLKNCLAAEWARYGIRVNTISPGYMDTILNEGDGIAEARTIWASRNPTGRMGLPHELTGAVVMLSSSSSSYLNGCDIVVDGGAIVF